MPVVLEDSQSGWMQNAGLYIAPAYIDRRASGNYLYADDRNGHDNCHALLLSGFHQPDKIVADITPGSQSRTAIRSHAHPRHQH